MSEEEYHPDQLKIEDLAHAYEHRLKAKKPINYPEEVFVALAEYYFVDLIQSQKALNVIDVGLEKFPNSFDLLILKTKLYIDEDSLQEASEILDKLELYHPFEKEIKFLRALIAYLWADEEQGKYYLEHIKDDPQLLNALYVQLGFSNYNNGNFEDSLKFFKISLKYDARNILVVLEMLNIYFLLGKADEGLTYFKDLVDRDPYNDLAWYALGMIYREDELNDEAMEAFEYAVAINDKMEYAWFQMGSINLNLTNYQKALQCFLEANKNVPSAENLIHIGAAYEHLESYTEAMKNYKLALKLDDTYADAWYGVGSVLFEQDKYLESINFIKKAIKLDNSNADYFGLLGDAETKLGNYVSADEAYHEAIELNPIDVDIWLNWSLLYFEQESYQRAFEIIEEAIIELPSEADLYYRAAVYLIYNSQIKRAHDFLEDALLLDYEGHEQLYDFFSKLETLKALQKIIDKYRPNK